MGFRDAKSADKGMNGCSPYTASLRRVIDYSKEISKTLENMTAEYTNGDPRYEALLYAIGLCYKDITRMEDEVKRYDES